MIDRAHLEIFLELYSFRVCSKSRILGHRNARKIEFPLKKLNLGVKQHTVKNRIADSGFYTWGSAVISLCPYCIMMLGEI